MDPKFDYESYLENYSDLRHFNKDEAYNHWITHGINEGRTCKSLYTTDPYFDYDFYLENYSDLIVI
jgi:hypothetical protein